MKTESNLPDVVISLLQKIYDADIAAHTPKSELQTSTTLVVSENEEDEVEGGFFN